MKIGWVGVVVIASAIGLAAAAQVAPEKVAPTPPMGWNSWDSYGLTITEEQFRASTKLMVEKLKPAGYVYDVIDEGWFFFNPEDRPKPETLRYAVDAYGRYVPVPARFPSAKGTGMTEAPPPAPETPVAGAPKLAATIENTSFKPLADWVHAQGLKFGIHIVRGIPRASVERNLPIANSSFHAQDAADTNDACPWDPTNWGVKDNAAGQAWYDSIISQYAGWGVDLLKVDCIANNPYKIDEIRMIRRAIDKVAAKTGRPMVLSLSPGPTAPAHAYEVQQLANMWRISNDFWDVWADNPTDTFPQGLHGQFARTATWAPYAGPGHWPDADMLPLGHLGPVPGWGKPRDSRLTATEQQTVMTLWSMARSPLIIGANLTEMNDATLKLLTNADVLAIDQTATRSGEVLHAEGVARSGNVVVWTADLPEGFPGGYTQALALFNTGDQLVTISTSFEAYRIDSATYHVRDAWAERDLGKHTSIENLSLDPHASTLWLLKK